MEPFIWIAGVVIVLGLGWFGLQQLRKKNSAQIAQATTREAAQAANAKLDETSRNAIYRNLAKGDVMSAVQNYRAVTGESVKDCVIAVRSLDKYPQAAPSKELPVSDEEIEQLRSKLEAQIAEEDQAGREGAAPAAEDGFELSEELKNELAEVGEDSWVVPREWSEQFKPDEEPSSTHFKMAFEVDGEAREFSSEQLPPNEYDQLFSMLRDSNFAGAAEMLHGYTGLPVEDLERMISSSPMAGQSAQGSVADFKFEGQGPDGPVHFDAAELPEEERDALFAAIADRDLQAMAQIIVRHTSLPEDIVREMLRSFVKGDD